jgi:hypothetical protein
MRHLLLYSLRRTVRPRMTGERDVPMACRDRHSRLELGQRLMHQAAACSCCVTDALCQCVFYPVAGQCSRQTAKSGRRQLVVVREMVAGAMQTLSLEHTCAATARCEIGPIAASVAGLSADLDAPLTFMADPCATGTHRQHGAEEAVSSCCQQPGSTRRPACCLLPQHRAAQPRRAALVRAILRTVTARPPRALLLLLCSHNMVPLRCLVNR